MNTSDKLARLRRFLVMLVSSIVVFGCVSTTTGGPEKKPDMAEAASINFQLAIEYFQSGNYELARDRLMLSTEQDPTQGVVWSTLATTYEQLGNLRLAEEAHGKALRAGPRSFDVQNSYAVFLCRQERYEDAQKQFEKSISGVTNDNPELMMTNAGVCMMQKPDYEKAEDFFRRALERQANHPEALLQMALLKFQTEDNLGARAFLQRYNQTNPPSPGTLYLCVLIEEKMGDDRARLDCADELLKTYPESEESRRILES